MEESEGGVKGARFTQRVVIAPAVHACSVGSEQ